MSKLFALWEKWRDGELSFYAFEDELDEFVMFNYLGPNIEWDTFAHSVAESMKLYMYDFSF